jgi:membrane protein implicated in regulation of membrane protease activity
MMIFYAVCLVVGLMFTLLSAIFGHFFGGHDGGHVGTGGHAEAGFDDSGVPGISFFSPLVMASFVSAFGGLGILFSDIKATSSVWLSAPLAVAGAFCISMFVLWLFNMVFSRAQSSSESHVASLVGQTATLISSIPENGVGEIAYVQGGSRYSAPARSEKGVAIAVGQTVKITRVVGTQYFVESVDTAAAQTSTTTEIRKQ